MTTTTRDSDRDGGEPEIRETYEQYEVGDSVVGMIADPENEYAWIQSDVTMPIKP